MGVEIRPTAMACPCLVCEQDRKFEQESRDLREHIDLRNACQQVCETYGYFERYGINRLVEPDPVELDPLITMVNTHLYEIEKSGVGEGDIGRIEVLGKRLSVILNMEEAKISAARSALERIELIKDTDGS